MAEKINIAPAYLCAVENGAKPIAEALLIRLERTFAETPHEKKRLRAAAIASCIQRKIPRLVSTKAYFYVEDLWACMTELDDEDWVALHTVLDVIRPNRAKKEIGGNMESS